MICSRAVGSLILNIELSPGDLIEVKGIEGRARLGIKNIRALLNPAAGRLEVLFVARVSGQASASYSAVEGQGVDSLLLLPLPQPALRDKCPSWCIFWLLAWRDERLVSALENVTMIRQRDGDGGVALFGCQHLIRFSEGK